MEQQYSMPNYKQPDYKHDLPTKQESDASFQHSLSSAAAGGQFKT